MAPRKPSKPAQPEPEVQTVAVHFDGKLYSADSLTLGDIADLEDQLDETFELIDWTRKRPALALVWLVRRQTEPDLTFEDVAGTPVLSMFAPPEEAADPPTDGTEDGSVPGADGSPGSPATTGSARGRSSS